MFALAPCLCTTTVHALCSAVASSTCLLQQHCCCPPRPTLCSPSIERMNAFSLLAERSVLACSLRVWLPFVGRACAVFLFCCVLVETVGYRQRQMQQSCNCQVDEQSTAARHAFIRPQTKRVCCLLLPVSSAPALACHHHRHNSLHSSITHLHTHATPHNQSHTSTRR